MMYGFGMVALLGLATVGVGAVAYRYLSLAREFWALLIVLLGIGAAWLANFDLFGIWGLAVRDHAIAVTLTGLAVAGAGYFWRVILEFFAGISRKFTDQARSLEMSEQLRRVA
jgi:hypothetical protein